MSAAKNSAVVRPNWQANLARLTVFLRPGAGARIPWNALTGSTPAASNTQGVVITESGPFGGAQLTVQNQPNRTDILLVPQSGVTAAPGIPTLGPFPNAINQFVTVLPSWVSKFPPTVRIAVGLQLLEPAKSIDDANKRLLAFAPQVTVDLTGATDFLFQINVPVASTVRSSISINRLSKLLVHQVQEFAVTSTGIQPAGLFIAPGLEIDISTPAENTSDLNGAGFDKLVAELVSAAIRIADTGLPL